MIYSKLRWYANCDKCGTVVETNASSWSNAVTTMHRVGWEVDGINCICEICKEKIKNKTQ